MVLFEVPSLDLELREKGYPIALWVSVIFNPVYVGWSVLDHLLEPAAWRPLLLIRILVVTLNTAAIGGLWLSGKKHRCFEAQLAGYYAYGWGVVAMLPLVSEGVVVYCAGLMLILIAIGALPTWPLRWCATAAAGIWVPAMLMLVALSDRWPLGQLISCAFLLTTGALVGLVGATTKSALLARDYEARVRVHELADALAIARDSALAAARAKGEFLANMSHEIRTPMNAVLGYASLLDRSQLPPEDAEMIDGIQSSGEVLLELINKILDYSKAEAGRMELEARDFDLPATTEAAVGVIRSVAAQKGLSVRLEFGAEVPRWLRGDRGRLLQVMLNLLGNAVKFTDRGEVVIRWSLRAPAASVGAVALRCEVLDSGIGISDEAKQRLFAPFTQADATITRRFGGTGLGLSISRLIIQAMNGTIGADSAPGRGSCFWFEVAMEAGTAPDVARSGPAAEPAALADRALRVLVVDDNVLNRKIVTRMLDRLGCEVTVAHDGRQAVELAAARSYDLILMDAQMPEMDGLEATRRIRRGRHGATAQVVALTANVTREYQAECAEVGMDDFLAKPVTLSQLSALLTRMRRPRETRPSLVPLCVGAGA